MDTHEPLPGIEVGDIGTKLGYNSTDNGYLLLNQVRVPRKALLSRFAEITPEGDLDIKADLRILYSIMSKVRLYLIRASGFALYRQARHAIRYAVCRRQFANQKGTKAERKLLDYQVHCQTLSKHVANAIVI